ncbi:AAA family ATPase [Marinactinospora rubrisoli]|uniref:AAA family ATPase n=1 Tax=Marinactinospora rubrisoli TaxID=2715399 RepID=A0ABW2KLG6_9ACTN
MATSPPSSPERSEHEPETDAPRPAWWIYRGTGQPRPYFDLADVLPPAPPWRRFDGGPPLAPPPDDEAEMTRVLGPATRAQPVYRPQEEIEAVNAALRLRRPLLVTGPPGIGKSSLAYRVARELKLGRVLRWPINSRTDLRSGLYEYDPIARINDISMAAAGARALGREDGRADPAGRRATHSVGDYLRLAALGTALLPYTRPRVLLIDEFDKGDLDLANDLLDVLEAGGYQIPELSRLRSTAPEITVPIDDPDRTARIRHGMVRCAAFPFIVITSNGERPFPPAFRRRCLELHLAEPTAEQLADIVVAHFTDRTRGQDRELIESFLRRYQSLDGLSVDQLLNSVYLASTGVPVDTGSSEDNSLNRVLKLVWQRLTEAGRE